MPTPPNPLSAGAESATAGPSLRNRRQKLSRSADNTPQSAAPVTATTTATTAADSKKKTKDGNPQISRTQRQQQKLQKRRRSGDGLGAGLLAIGIYALMHESGIMTLLLLAIVLVAMEPSTQRIFLFFLVLLNFAEYFYLLPPALARYQQEDWWDIPTIKKALLTMTIFWSIAWCSACTSNYLESKEQRLKLEKEKRRIQQQALFQS